MWRTRLATYAYPIIGSVPIQEIETEHVLQIVQPLWATKTPTARRLLNHMELIFNDARTRSARTDQNPARWRGFLDRSAASAIDRPFDATLSLTALSRPSRIHGRIAAMRS